MEEGKTIHDDIWKKLRIQRKVYEDREKLLVFLFTRFDPELPSNFEVLIGALVEDWIVRLCLGLLSSMVHNGDSQYRGTHSDWQRW